MRIYKLGGGHFPSILSFLFDKDPQGAGKELETIIEMYPENMRSNSLEPTELANYIVCQIALNCTLPGSSKLLSLDRLQNLSKRFITKGENMSGPSALFLLSLPFWPESGNELSSADAQLLLSSINALQLRTGPETPLV